MLRQSLKALGGEALLEKAGIDPTARPEELDVDAIRGAGADSLPSLILPASAAARSCGQARSGARGCALRFGRAGCLRMLCPWRMLRYRH